MALPTAEQYPGLTELRQSFAAWCKREIVPHHREWEKRGCVERQLWNKAGANRFLCMTLPREYGGHGCDFRHSCVVIEELAACGATGVTFALHSDVIAPYIATYGTEAQKRRWLPGMASGELVAAIALTEPSGGSDLQAICTTATLSGNVWVLNGVKSFISNGVSHDLCLVLCRTEAQPGFGSLSLIVVERDAPGFSRAGQYEKMGYHAQDTAELRFADCHVPKDNLLGARGSGLLQVLSRVAHERIVIAVHCLAAARAVFGLAVDRAKRRQAFGAPLGSLQAIRFALAEAATEISVSEAFVNQCVDRVVQGQDINVDANKAKYWTSEMLGRVVDSAVQIHGGMGYMLDSPVGRAYVDARVQRIFGGATEVLKESIGRSLL